MKRALATLNLLAAFGVASAAPHDYAIRTSYQEDGSEIGWYVSEAQFLKTPEWKFDGKSSPPLGMPAAYQRASAWLKKTFPENEFFQAS